ncbi:MAG: hypothetical protein A2992_10035 [Elusimicrobia bacterium RIFCSPLOWO2_01_FULL_59_12]|nr:MAG: hypothetical protein A2992_10035 [Elusimicrobia bacterium RIFCSPLOWO2_01_FULL_59_12]
MKESPWVAVCLAFVFGVWGLSWGLPSKERADLFLKPDLRTPEFFLRVEKNRDDIYDKISLNPISHYGRMARAGKSYTDTSFNLLSVYSSFLVRTHHGDEQQALVMLFRLNPRQGKWYPYTFQYGGAYIYPLAAALKGLQLAGLIKLVPQASFYYAHPDEIANVYRAVRGWSVLAMMLSIFPLFYLGRRLVGHQAAFWASCFYALTPACLGTAKLAKPHVWAAAWMLSSLYFCLRAREEPRLRPLALAAGEARRRLEQTGYARIQAFSESPLQKMGFSDPFTTGNFPLEIYAR